MAKGKERTMSIHPEQGRVLELALQRESDLGSALLTNREQLWAHMYVPQSMTVKDLSAWGGGGEEGESCRSPGPALRVPCSVPVKQRSRKQPTESSGGDNS